METEKVDSSIIKFPIAWHGIGKPSSLYKIIRDNIRMFCGSHSFDHEYGFNSLVEAVNSGSVFGYYRDGCGEDVLDWIEEERMESANMQTWAEYLSIDVFELLVALKDPYCVNIFNWLGVYGYQLAPDDVAIRDGIIAISDVLLTMGMSSMDMDIKPVMNVATQIKLWLHRSGLNLPDISGKITLKIIGTNVSFINDVTLKELLLPINDFPLQIVEIFGLSLFTFIMREEKYKSYKGKFINKYAFFNKLLRFKKENLDPYFLLENYTSITLSPFENNGAFTDLVVTKKYVPPLVIKAKEGGYYSEFAGFIAANNVQVIDETTAEPSQLADFMRESLFMFDDTESDQENFLVETDVDVQTVEREFMEPVYNNTEIRKNSTIVSVAPKLEFEEYRKHRAAVMGDLSREGQKKKNKEYWIPPSIPQSKEDIDEALKYLKRSRRFDAELFGAFYFRVKDHHSGDWCVSCLPKKYTYIYADVGYKPVLWISNAKTLYEALFCAFSSLRRNWVIRRDMSDLFKMDVKYKRFVFWVVGRGVTYRDSYSVMYGPRKGGKILYYKTKNIYYNIDKTPNRKFKVPRIPRDMYPVAKQNGIILVQTQERIKERINNLKQHGVNESESWAMSMVNITNVVDKIKLDINTPEVASFNGIDRDLLYPDNWMTEKEFYPVMKSFKLSFKNMLEKADRRSSVTSNYGMSMGLYYDYDSD